MADISKLEQQADLLMRNVSGWEQSTLNRIGRRIRQYGKLTLSDLKSINNVAVVKRDMDAITKELAKVTGYNMSQIEKMYADLLTEQHLANQPLYDYRNRKFIPFAQNKELQAITRAFAETSGGTMLDLANTKALSILNSKGKVIGFQNYYTSVLDKAVMQISTGANDFYSIMRDTIIELGGSGIRVDYGGGVTRRLDTAIRQSLLWSGKQASNAYNEMIGQQLDCNGYEIDYHPNPRPSHEFMQGKQYVIGDNTKIINKIEFVGFEQTDPTSPNGLSASEALGEYGCLHYKTPIICGISQPRYSADELKRLKENDKTLYNIDGKQMTGYQAKQAMRRLENEIRKQKTIKQLASSSGDKGSIAKECNAKIKAYKAKYEHISNITGISQDAKRMSVPRQPKTN